MSRKKKAALAAAREKSAEARKLRRLVEGPTKYLPTTPAHSIFTDGVPMDGRCPGRPRTEASIRRERERERERNRKRKRNEEEGEGEGEGKGEGKGKGKGKGEVEGEEEVEGERKRKKRKTKRFCDLSASQQRKLKREMEEVLKEVVKKEIEEGSGLLRGGLKSATVTVDLEYHSGKLSSLPFSLFPFFPFSLFPFFPFSLFPFFPFFFLSLNLPLPSLGLKEQIIFDFSADEEARQLLLQHIKKTTTKPQTVEE